MRKGNQNSKHFIDGFRWVNNNRRDSIGSDSVHGGEPNPFFKTSTHLH